MRTLKKSLALVLVIAIVLSIGVVGASAAFTDTTDSDYQTAIGVLSGLKVLDGMTDTTFEPTGSLTREQGAKIITYLMLSPAGAELLKATTAPFADVTADRWSAGYIAYLTSQGVISGVGDNNFDPTGTLSTSAFTKMLLVALGYNATTEGLEGDSWAINTAALAVGAGISDSGIVLSSATTCTREQAAQLSYKTLTATMVTYVGGTNVTTGGTTIVVGGTRQSLPNASTSYNGGAENLMQFCEAKFPTLKLSTSTDDFGRTVNVWKLGKTVICTENAKTPAVTFTAKTTSTNVSKALADYSAPAGAIISVINGENGATINTASYKADIASLTGNGKLVEVYATTAGVINAVVVTNETLATIKKVDTKNEIVTVKYGSYTTTVDSESEFYEDLAGMEVDDYILVALSNASADDSAIYSVAIPETVSGTYTASNTTKGTITVGGTTYTVHGIGTDFNTLTGGMTFGTTYTLYLDSYGYVISKVTGTVAASDYAYILATSRDGTARTGYEYSAELLFTDGTINWVDVAKVGTTKVADDATFAANGYAKQIASYTEDDGVYTLGTPAGDITADGNISKGNPTILGTYIATNSTVFLIADADGNYNTYTGIKNVPSISVATDKATVLATSSVASIVVVRSNAAVTSSVVYVYSATPVGSRYVTGVPSNAVYSLKAIVDGEDTTVESAQVANIYSASAFVPGFYTVTYTDGYISAATAVTTTTLSSDTPAVKSTNYNFTTAASDTLALTSGYLKFTDADAAHYFAGVVADGFTLYEVTGGVATEISASDISAFAAGTLNVVVNSDGYIAYAVYSY